MIEAWNMTIVIILNILKLYIYIFIVDLLENESHKLELKPCPICSRSFNTTTYDKHVAICSTTASKKRNIFDSSRQRRDGTDLASYLPKHFGLPASRSLDKSISLKPAQVVHPMKKEVSGVKSRLTNNFVRPVLNSMNLEENRSTRTSSRTQPPPYEQCSYCQRYFGLKAYDRHVEWCKEKAIQQAIKNPASNNAAKDRLNARTNYRAPCLRYV